MTAIELNDLEDMSLRLRYFDCRGRVGALRQFLRHKKIAFDDDRVPRQAVASAWQQQKRHLEFGGPFAKLPVLWADDWPIAETLAIQHFVDRKTRPSLLLSAGLAHASLQSHLYQDVLVNLGLLVWGNLAFPGVDGPKFWQQAALSLAERWRFIDRFLQSQPQMLGGDRWYLTDFCLREGWQLTVMVLGAATQDWVLPQLQSFLATAAAASLPEPEEGPFTSHPDEAEIIAQGQSWLKG